MPANWLYVVGGIFIGLLVFTIAYNLLTISMIQAQKQTVLTTFNDLQTDIENVCFQEMNNSVLTKITIPQSVRVLYVTDEIKTPLISVVEKIKNSETAKEKNLCIQFNDEKILRCKGLTCNTNMSYVGSLPEYMDIKAMVNKILGKAPFKDYNLRITKVLRDEVEVVIGGKIE